jgi:hypothetical protein
VGRRITGGARKAAEGSSPTPAPLTGECALQPPVTPRKSVLRAAGRAQRNHSACRESVRSQSRQLLRVRRQTVIRAEEAS